MLTLGVALGASHMKPSKYEASHVCDRERNPHTCELITDVQPAGARRKTCERGSGSFIYLLVLLHVTSELDVETLLEDGITRRRQ